jgi:Zn-dependent protease with chaperone function
VTFAARDLLVSLAFFAVLYSSLSALVVSVWRSVAWRRAKLSAELLFGLRVFSFAVSSIVTVFFTFPSFWLMERRSPDEDGGTFVLAACAFVIAGAGVFRLVRDQVRTRRAIGEWVLRTSSADDAPEPVLGAAKGAPALMLTGILQPKVMISDAAASLLSEDELQVAIRHELGHRRSWDNLKKVLISATPFPGMRGIETAWREAAELAADDAAVENRQEALDLAAALIKLSRSSKQSVEPALASGLVCSSSSIAVRVERLLEWRSAGRGLRRTWPWVLLVMGMVSVAVVSHYGATLAITHRLTELLVP